MTVAADEFEGLRRAVRRRFGGAAEIDIVTVPTLGGINRTIVFDVIEGAARRRVVSKQETMDAGDSPFLPTDVQFRLMKIVHAHGFPAPEPIFEYDGDDGMGRGYVTAFIEGETMPQRIIREAAYAELRPRIVIQLAELLGRLHAIDPSDVAFLKPFPDSVDPIGSYLRLFDRFAEAHPALELGFRWLERNRLPPVRPVLVHGDFRTGNLMVAAEGIRAVLDWECSHLGSGIEDIGWLCTRSWRFGAVDFPVGGLGQRAPFYAAYEAMSGTKTDPEAVKFWEVFGLVRWAVYNIMQAHGHCVGGRRSVVYAAMGRNTAQIEYDLLMTLSGHYH